MLLISNIVHIDLVEYKQFEKITIDNTFAIKEQFIELLLERERSNQNNAINSKITQFI